MSSIFHFTPPSVSTKKLHRENMQPTCYICRFTPQPLKRLRWEAFTPLLHVILSIALLFSPFSSFAQQQPNHLPPLPELLQYQASKARQGTRWTPFRKYAMHRSRLPETLSPDSVQLWVYHALPPDSAYTPTLPLCRQLKATAPQAFAVIDHTQSNLQLVFWDKRIYRHYADWLNRIGYTLPQHRPASNVLSFRKSGVSICVDITVWADSYVMSVY